MTHYNITIGNDVARDVHCDITMGHDVAMGTYDVTMNTDVARTLIYVLVISMPNYDISIFLVKSLKFYIKHYVIKTKVVRHKNRTSS